MSGCFSSFYLGCKEVWAACEYDACKCVPGGGLKLALNHRPVFTGPSIGLWGWQHSFFPSFSFFLFATTKWSWELEPFGDFLRETLSQSTNLSPTKGLSLEPLDHGWPELRTQQGYSAILLFAFHWIQSVFTLMLPLGPYCEMKSLILSLRWWNAILRLYSNNNNCLFQICVIVWFYLMC